jgi:cell wall assembly regulator SMI1
MPDLITRLRAAIRERGAELGRGASEEEIAAFEARHGVHLPPEVRRYFAEVNGFAQGRGEMDAELVSLWPLSEVRLLSDEAPESTVPEPERYFVFGDWSLWCSRCT